MGVTVAMISTLNLLIILHHVFAEPVVQSLHETPETLEDLNHPCARECRLEETKRCHYKFKVEYYITMSKACFDCPFNLTDCGRPHCVPSDGFERPIVTVNRRLPGPTIHVCVGDEVIVDVENDLMSDSTSIHWHGIHQRGTQYMDGVPFLTQCPIVPGSTFRYHFLADNPGTHYWHSHSGFQRMDGMFGSFVVREPLEHEPQKNHYDIDDFNHVFIINDWMDKLGIDKFVNHHHTTVKTHHTTQENLPYNLLVNGRGKYQVHKRGLDEEVYAPLPEIIVKPGYRHRIRVISNSMENCPIVISIDNHTLIPIATDGMSIEPIEVDSLTIYGGERWDFVVNAYKQIASYWIKFQGLLACGDSFHSAYQLAIMRYEGANAVPGSLEKMTYESTTRQGFNLNKLNEAPGDGTFSTAAEIRSLDQDDNFSRSPDYKFWLHFDFKSKDNYLFHNKQLYPFTSVPLSQQVYIPQINEISNKYPNAPPLSQPEDVDYSSFCNVTTTKKNCSQEFCHCPYILSVEKDSLVEVILVDEGFVYWANHPFHLHGHTFKVLGMGRIGESVSLETVKVMDEEGFLERNLDHPPTKDTVTVPDGGYTIIRFIASNPGYWFFHCHLSFHVEIGMGLVFRVGDSSMLPPVPKGFPRCGSWQPEPEPDYRETIKNYLNNQSKNKVTVDLDLLPSEDGHKIGPSYTAGNTKQQVTGTHQQSPSADKFSSGQCNLVLSFLVFLSTIVMNLLTLTV